MILAVPTALIMILMTRDLVRGPQSCRIAYTLTLSQAYSFLDFTVVHILNLQSGCRVTPYFLLGIHQSFYLNKIKSR